MKLINFHNLKYGSQPFHKTENYLLRECPCDILINKIIWKTSCIISTGIVWIHRPLQYSVDTQNFVKKTVQSFHVKCHLKIRKNWDRIKKYENRNLVLISWRKKQTKTVWTIFIIIYQNSGNILKLYFCKIQRNT